MNVSLSDRDRAALRRGVVGAGLMALWMFGAKPMIGSIRELSAEVDEARAMLTREVELLDAVTVYAQRADQAGSELLAMAPRLFGGSTRGVAAAYLAEYVQNAAGNSNALLSRLDPGEAEPLSGGVEALSASVHGESDLEGLLTLLYLLEGGEKLVKVSDLRIQAGSAARMDTDAMEIITFEFRVTGYQLSAFDGDAPVEQADEETAP